MISQHKKKKFKENLFIPVDAVSDVSILHGNNDWKLDFDGSVSPGLEFS